MNPVQLKCFPDDTALAAAAAAAWLDAIAAARETGRDFTVALSGGRVMRNFFAAAVTLATSRGTDFNQVHFFWADERCVPPHAAESNFRLAQVELLEPARISNKHIHRVRGEFPPATAARAAGRELRQVCGVSGDAMPVLDLILLGMGEDGHVASLFPGDAATAADVTSVFLPVYQAPKPPPNRITLGHGPLAAARAVWVLASGPDKQAALRNSLSATGTTPNTVRLVSAEVGQGGGGGQNARATGGPGILPGSSFTDTGANRTVSGTTPLAQVIQRRTTTTIFTDIAQESAPRSV